MRAKLMLAVILGLACTAYGKEPKAYETGKLLQMDSVQCGTTEKDGTGFAGEILGTDSTNKKTHQLLCQEYVLQAEHVTYRIRPRDEKHAALLPVESRADFRVEKDKFILRVEGTKTKEHEYIVVSITPRTDSSSADASPAHVNHLQ